MIAMLVKGCTVAAGFRILGGCRWCIMLYFSAVFFRGTVACITRYCNALLGLDILHPPEVLGRGEPVDARAESHSIYTHVERDTVT